MLIKRVARTHLRSTMALACSLVLMACQPINLGKEFQNSSASEGIKSDQEIQTAKSVIDSLTDRQKALVALPNISSVISRIEASRSATKSIALSNSMSVSATSNSGVAPNKKDEIEGYVDASLIAEKPIYDANRIALRTMLSELETKSLEIELQQQLNSLALAIAKQRYAISFSEQITATIDDALEEYADNRSMLGTLVTAGVIQKLDFLDLEQRVQGIEGVRHQYITKAIDAEGILSTKYAAISDLKPVPLARLIDANLSDDKSTRLATLTLQKQSLALNRKLKQADKSWGASFATSLTVKSSDNDPEVFSGLKFTLPIFDGGQVDAALLSLDSQIEASQADIDAHLIDLKSAHFNWEQQKTAYEKSVEINSVQRELVMERQVDLDRQLNAGRVKLDQVITNKLTLLDLEIKNIELAQSLVIQGLEVIGLYGDGCSAIELCEDVEVIIESAL